MSQNPASSRVRAIARKVAVAVAFLVVVILLLVWLAGGFHRKVGSFESVAGAATGQAVAEAVLEPARLIRVPVTETAVGTVRAVHEVSLASKLLAKVVTLEVKAGQVVRKDQVLVKLDDTDLRARREQAEAAVAAARAARNQAKVEFDRVQSLYERQAAAKIEFDRADTALKSAEAELQRAEQGLNEAAAILDYATIRAPIDGTVVDKKVEVGDTVTPGQVLLTLYDPTHMQLVASVRESLTHRLRVGQTIDVRVDALNKTCQGQISEIVPEAESASRTFSVKVTGPCPPGIYSGMFGRLLIPLEEQEILVIPREAVKQVGQLDVVEVAEGDVLRRRAVQLGRMLDDRVEVLSGLRAGERVAVGR
ncbi:MAG: efflux RND transporter periplasmic adaptor subunit [Planctomycetota bacterium]